MPAHSIVPASRQREPLTAPSPREEFEALLRGSAGMLTVYLHALAGSRDAVDDLFQETLLVAWRRFADFDRSRPFGPWLRGIAARHARKRAERSDLRERDLVELEERMAASTDGSERLSDTLERLRACLGRLPRDLFGAIELSYRGGLSVREVAARTGATEEAVKKRLQRARRQLGECLRGER